MAVCPDADRQQTRCAATTQAGLCPRHTCRSGRSELLARSRFRHREVEPIVLDHLLGVPFVAGEADFWMIAHG